MILALDLKNAMVPLLESEGTQRFLDQQDFIPAINSALRSANALVGAVFAENKGGEEMFRDITVTRVFQTNAFGGVTFDPAALGSEVWSIAAIYPEPTVNPPNATVNGTVPQDQSLYRSDVAMRTPGKFHTRRITVEQIAQTESNAFMDGSEKLADGPNRSYAYYWVGDRSATGFNPGSAELVIVPVSRTARSLVAITYLKGVDEITSLNDTIPYPASLFQILRDLALNDLSVKMGGRLLYDVSISSVRQLILASA